ncbi:MAG: hypothetical protein E6G44_12500 [Actinobacteria bacterium]|nr:MAG: hypothetical protein E6G44_12500 [Actinomycetota bacterium]
MRFVPGTTGGRPRRRRSVFALVAVATVAAGCTKGASPVTSPSQPPRSVATAPPNVPNPFKVTARFDPSSLGLEHPIGLAIGPDGNLYVTDTSQAVAVISPDGKVLGQWGSPGTGAGELSFVSFSGDPSDIHAAIAVGSDGQVYVSDNGNYRIQVFSGSGAFTRQFGRKGKGDIAVDAAGSVYVADDQGESVSKFSPTGHFEWRIGGFQAKDPDLIGHEHLALVDAHGRVVMVNDDIGRVLYVNSRGHKVDGFSAPGCNVTVDALGYTFVNSCFSGQTQVFDRKHSFIGVWSGPDNTLSMAPVFGSNGRVFALGQDGTILELEVTLP